MNTFENILLIDEVYEVLTDNIELLSADLQEEFENICLPIDSDMSYIIGDLIRKEECDIKWEIRENDNTYFLVITDAQNEIKSDVLEILKKGNAVHIYENSFDNYGVVN